MITQISHKKQFVFKFGHCHTPIEHNVLISAVFMLNNTVKWHLNNCGTRGKARLIKFFQVTRQLLKAGWGQFHSSIYQLTPSAAAVKSKIKSIVCDVLLCDHTAFSRHQTVGCRFVCAHREYELDTTYQIHLLFTMRAQTQAHTQIKYRVPPAASNKGVQSCEAQASNPQVDPWPFTRTHMITQRVKEGKKI